MRYFVSKGFLGFIMASFFISLFVTLTHAQTPQSMLAQAERDIKELENMIQVHPSVTYESFNKISSFITIQASITVNNARLAGANTTALEKRLIGLGRTLHERNVSRVMYEMENFSKLTPGDKELGTRIETKVWSWRFAFQEAKKKGVLVSQTQERRRKELEIFAYELNAEHALKEYRDFIECKPSRFASRGAIYGWNVYHDELYYQTLFAVQLVEALETPNALRIGSDYYSLREEYAIKFFVNGPIHGLGGMRDYGDVCGKLLKSNSPSK